MIVESIQKYKVKAAGQTFTRSKNQARNRKY